MIADILIEHAADQVQVGGFAEHDRCKEVLYSFDQNVWHGYVMAQYETDNSIIRALDCVRDCLCSFGGLYNLRWSGAKHAFLYVP